MKTPDAATPMMAGPAIAMRVLPAMVTWVATAGVMAEAMATSLGQAMVVPILTSVMKELLPAAATTLATILLAVTNVWIVRAQSMAPLGKVIVAV